MKIFDCFMYFDEEIVLDLRLNALNDYVDHFVIVESRFNHKGDKRDLKFNIEKFQKVFLRATLFEHHRVIFWLLIHVQE